MKKPALKLAKAIGLAVFVCCGLAVTGSRTNGAVIDGDFSTPDLGNKDFKEFNTSPPPMGQWTVGGAVTLYKNGITDPVTGQTLTTPDSTGQALLLRGSTVFGGGAFSTRSVLGSVSQDLNVLAGGQYQIGFEMGALQGAGLNSAVQVQVVYADNTGSLKMLFQNTFSSGMNWGGKTFDFTVPGANPGQHTSVTLVFADVGNDSSLYVPAAIDKVSLTAVPEPYQYGLVGILAMLGMAGRGVIARKKLA